MAEETVSGPDGDDAKAFSLSQTMEHYREVSHARQRLDLASRFFASLISGRGDMVDRTPSSVMAWCWQTADAMLAQMHAKPSPRLTLADLDYLRWLLVNGPQFASEFPAGHLSLTPMVVNESRRALLKAGLIRYGNDGYDLTPQAAAELKHLILNPQAVAA